MQTPKDTTMGDVLAKLDKIQAVLERIAEAQAFQQQLAFSQQEAAELLGVHPATLRIETKLGRIRRSYRKLYPRAEIERYLAEGLKRNEYMAGGK